VGRWPLDEPRPALAGIGGRFERAFDNYLETFPFFAAAVLIAHAAGRHDWATVWGAQLYFYASLIYLPIYAVGIPCASHYGLGRCHFEDHSRVAFASLKRSPKRASDVKEQLSSS